ncbi:TPA: hypothetical protein ACIJ06_004827 [Klebsiella pneumoniae]|uniref:hypothetical protein n=1 Tax=Klebsiella pneumoniae complex TaxID=3390273 RepID=UPI0007CBB2A4|nr:MULTISPECIES: hypothetical protein [Klebsiella]MCA4139793.1 hypothetical protein [Klebsiella pneumoniae]MCL7665195.1 hypothetical protein [Klebsiella pneumoniae]MCX2357440.1 hypothetical protein [Klebsiella variicola]MDX7454634.1 hypothetical protein [Klebsiella pneumoniae]SAX33328.1 Uncharacterised protein [Klebsiella pneumoniae]
MATQFENGLTLSGLAERNAELVTEVEKLRAERDASLNAERVWEKTMMEVCGEDGPASVAVEIRNLLALRNTALTALKAQVEQLAAENVAIRETIEAVRGVADNSSGIAGWHLNGEIAQWSEILPEIDDIETPATDRIVAEAEARGVEKAIAHLEKKFSNIGVQIMNLQWLADSLRKGASE